MTSHRLFVQKLIRVDSKKNIKTMHCCRSMHSPNKGSVMRKMSPCNGGIIVYLEYPSFFWFHKAQLWGYYQGTSPEEIWRAASGSGSLSGGEAPTSPWVEHRNYRSPGSRNQNIYYLIVIDLMTNMCLCVTKQIVPVIIKRVLPSMSRAVPALRNTNGFFVKYHLPPATSFVNVIILLRI